MAFVLPASSNGVLLYYFHNNMKVGVQQRSWPRIGAAPGEGLYRGRRCLVSVAAIDASTAIRTAPPLLTCSRITDFGPSATSDAISTPRFMGPGCMTSTLFAANFSRL